MDMKQNAIILTSGLSGSSVLTGLIVQAGYWAGDNTHKKEDYDTFENPHLIALNKRLFAEAGYQGNYLLEFPGETIARIADLRTRIDPKPYEALLEACDSHQPWVWKDPRLWMTIRFWQPMLALRRCRFIFLTRGISQSWVSATLRRQIRSYGDYRRYEECITASILSFMKENGLDYTHIRYEDLIERPSETIASLNSGLGTALNVDSLRAVYRKPLFTSPGGSTIDYVKAGLIYAKNYGQRVRSVCTPVPPRPAAGSTAAS
jgi:hypothetical protein